MSGPVIEVDRAAIRDNLVVVRNRVAPAELMAVVKDDAYGHSLDEVVAVLASEGVRRFGALDIATALRVKTLLPDAMVFAWVYSADDDLDAAVAAGVDLGVTDAAMLDRVIRTPGRAIVHLKIDSGLHRAGVLPSGWRAFTTTAASAERAGHLRVEGLWTHIAEASDESDSDAIALFTEAVASAESEGLRPSVRHLAASAASSARADARFDLVRVGAFLYGIAPGGGVSPTDVGLRPAMTLRAPVVEVSDDGKSARVGIGGVHGVLADAAGRVDVAISGRRAPVIHVDPLTITVETEQSPLVGDDVVLFGDGSSGEPVLQEWADAMGTIGEEIVTRLSASIPRRHVN